MCYIILTSIQHKNFPIQPPSCGNSITLEYSHAYQTTTLEYFVTASTTHALTQLHTDTYD